MNKQYTEKIKCWGIVQGVGFRPFVVQLADRFGLKGQVLNVGGLVEIQLTDTAENIDRFITALKKEKPEPAEIVHIKRERMEFIPFKGFTILDSDEGDDEAAMIPADLSICPECLNELKDPENPRFNHPFISCMVCGPRYTIIDKIPYDRDNTAMLEFPMCEFCQEEYNDRLGRRFHAQTISCHHCGPQFKLVRGEGDPIDAAAEILKQGGVIGFKGVGGYNLVCDPLNDSAVEKLRQVKGREEKPFAVMFKDLDMVKQYCQVSLEEANLIQSAAKPILLLEKEVCQSARAEWHRRGCQEFEKSRFIGAFLPSMGGQVLLLEKFGGPLIMTSANVSSLPMIKDDQEMADFMESSAGLIDETVTSGRRINVRGDDSVARIIDGQPQMIRRSKGYTPVPLYINPGEKKPGKDLMILSAGGQLKNSFALSKGPFSYLSQYFGDLDTVENCTLYKENIERMKTLFRINPKVVVCDMHPLYNSTSIAKKYAEKHGLPVIQVQHHHAHVASVMAEHGINEPVIGVSFDGTGYGTDGKIWGGEILLCHKERVERLSHLKYVKMIGGDSSMKEGWKSAMCYAYQLGGAKISEAKDSSEEFEVDISELVRNSGIEEFEGWATVKAALEYGVNTMESSSMGRLFDAVSSLLGICQENKYEGQCAILLEDAAARGIQAPGNSVRDDLALGFHNKVANTLLEQCLKYSEKTGIRKIALTGGVFQNKILMEESLRLLRSKEFEVFYNISVSPNDGGIALGQNYIAMHQMMLSPL